MFKIDVDNINGKTESLYVFGEQSILTELEDNQILLNHSCRQGHCGLCILQLLSGDVMHQDCLVPLSRGEILACQARPISDIKVSVRDF
ncbi:2Fe-2S iron-sulfur cluster-binding protein [bacterium endosymbiont of Bathymodiolus sp. 5 South]|jgi:ferredoxin/3-ketosteroid 9alpha-monooxygenase subunit B|uniref:2Fe-2S iron-sulfur cluster-binding protein n=1 Tax=bacterium endosymbiont of Bathymodiolus sp. 5 South TaxID=1181670 RepID=UPI0010AFA20A|nr:2Fe-2S iron-sulfur cluster binding domain-containing protein [bacterium endosymbiont of Bathymodiolus sp. 5 South]CAC9463358.1 Flavodoxin reductases (ferredoxin-NADPH reductases) family 1 [uncultured Gammaproteobacteria bacterium]CAC9654959.1 Flavodoxin reductases (ferredoxin-NADPH reductases) family 1 [uncultured Gammaproteobacteria bacterium]SHN92018.1 Flavodoxin reductases (ferredoxin-NADPH reductases) family 1 [bacterium endosymbiont of Bathymodiolus sp. 5 South]SSC07780.1 Flavodoxin red